MAKEYIDRKAVLVATDILDEFLSDSERLYFVKQIKEIPVADVAEVRHGRWIDSDDGNRYCSECGKSSLFFDSGNSFCRTFYRSRSNYCPNCGADMRGGKNE